MLPLARELTSPDEVLDLIPPRADVIVPLANGEPVALLDALDAHAERLDGVRVHQMHALHDRPYLHGQRGDNLRHISYLLSPVTRPAFLAGGCDLVPCHFSEVPVLLHTLVLPSTARGGTVSRIVPRLTPGSAVTTLKNTVDKVVTEHGVADLRGRTIRERARALIAVADPAFPDRLRHDAAELGYL